MSLGPKSTTPDGDDSNLPLWRKHFPIGLNDEASRSRREFIGGLSVAGGAMACGQAALNRAFPSSQSAEEKAKTTKHPPLVLDKKLSELDDGEALLFHYPNEKSPCLLVKFSSDDVVAFAQKCTHLACPVIPDSEANEFHCPCHHGSFDLRTGEPLAGPPRLPLRRINLNVSSDGLLTVDGFLG